MGAEDPLWQVFGSMSNNGLAVPLYVLIDAGGVIRYAGSGGQDLNALRVRLKELSANKDAATR